MKKYIIYIAILAAGLILGYIFFGKSVEENSNTKDVSDMSDSTNEQNQMWTCSMHPQIMQPEPGDCPICGMDLIPAATGADGLAMNEIKMTENAMALANIQTIIVGKGTIEGNVIALSGKIVINEDETATQPAHFNGRVEKLYINSLGERVKMGQTIAQIYSPELVAAQQELITAYRIRDSQPQLYNAVRNKFKNWKIHDAQLSEILATGQVKTRFTIFSHVSGVVSEILVNEGAHIMDGHPIFKVANLGTVWANFDVYENQISQFRKGQNLFIATNAYPNKVFNGKVDFIDPVLDTKTRTVKLRVVLNNKEDILKPGMFVTAKVAMTNASDKMESQITIPASAVMWTGERSLVYVKTNPNQPVFEMREVTLGTKNGDFYTISEGLKNGDEIVTNGTFTVDAAAQLQGKKSMMNTKGGKTMTGHEGHLGMENSNNNSTTDHSQMTKRLEVSTKFKEQLNTVFENYVSVNKALVNDDAETAKTSASSLQKSIGKVDVKLLKDDAHNHWVTLEKELKASTVAIATTSDIRKQREHFIHLSAHLINAVKTFGINQKVYVDYCPMANNNVGAYWLSKDKEIRNPYFGTDMLNCGSVTDEIE